MVISPIAMGQHCFPRRVETLGCAGPGDGRPKLARLEQATHQRKQAVARIVAKYGRSS